MLMMLDRSKLSIRILLPGLANKSKKKSFLKYNTNLHIAINEPFIAHSISLKANETIPWLYFVFNVRTFYNISKKAYHPVVELRYIFGFGCCCCSMLRLVASLKKKRQTITLLRVHYFVFSAVH